MAMARPTKLTEDLHERVTQYVRAGLFLKDAAGLSELAESTVHLWIERGQIEESRILSGETPEPEEAKYLEFSEAIDRARAYANGSDMNVISMAAREKPEWAERRLKLRNPSMFRQEVGLEIRRPSAEEREHQEKIDTMRRARRGFGGQ